MKRFQPAVHLATEANQKDRSDSHSRVRRTHGVPSHSRTQISAQCPYGADRPRFRSGVLARHRAEDRSYEALRSRPGLVVNEKVLISLYGLRRSEAACAAKLDLGKSIEVAAQEMFISEHAARTHLKRIFMKTDTHRQPELVLRLLM